MLKLYKVVCLSALVLSMQAFADAKSDLQSKLMQYTALKADFSQTVTRKDGSVVSTSTGTLALKKPGNLMLHTLNPDEQVLFTKGNTVNYYDPFVNQVTIFNVKDLYISPFSLLTSKDEKIWGQYDVTVNGSSYTLIPHKKAEVTQIVLTLNGDHVQELKVTMKDGNTNSYALSNLAYSVSDSEFNYEVPADAQIDDERN